MTPATFDPAKGIPAENLLLNRCCMIDVGREDEGIVIHHCYRSLSGEARTGATLGLTRVAAEQLAQRLLEVVQYG